MKLIQTEARKLIRALCLTMVLGWLALAADRAVAIDRIIPGSASISPNSVALANDILNRWEPIAVEAGQHSAAWRELFATQLSAMDASVLDTVNRVKMRGSSDAKASYAQFTQAVRSAEMQSYVLAQSGKGNMKLGSTSTDQVFIPIVPCRIVDTRNAGGPISAGQTRNFYFFASSGTFDWHTQGGLGLASTTCPGTMAPNGGSPSAAAITVTVVGPTAPGNWILWGGASPIPNASALNWDTGQVVANTTVVPAGGRVGTGPGGAIKDFAVEYNGPSGSADFVADVVGYFVENQATALDCSETGTTSTAIAANTQNTVVASACPAGWTLTGGLCNSNYHVPVRLIAQYYVGSFPQAQWSCRFVNIGSDTWTISASSRCCRAPGL